MPIYRHAVTGCCLFPSLPELWNDFCMISRFILDIYIHCSAAVKSVSSALGTVGKVFCNEMLGNDLEWLPDSARWVLSGLWDKKKKREKRMLSFVDRADRGDTSLYQRASCVIFEKCSCGHCTKIDDHRAGKKRIFRFTYSLSLLDFSQVWIKKIRRTATVFHYYIHVRATFSSWGHSRSAMRQIIF